MAKNNQQVLNYEKAANNYELALQNKPDFTAQYNLGRVYLRLSELTESELSITHAINMFRLNLKLEPNNNDNLFNLIQALRVYNDFTGEISILEEALNLLERLYNFQNTTKTRKKPEEH